ncbi:zinc finger protein 91 [Oryzias melastigma]|uniref:zinc finger protein 91 n=1 Tax=Oryzias melastigma TaxID=30732 RepID=UPI000CF7F4F6|nr:zinc finger protein 91 [Oryzias melastigma]
MPSAHRQNQFVMEKQKAVINVSSAHISEEPCSFICTECGGGFSQYASVLAHMTSHGPLDSFSFDGSSNGLEIPREYVLQENGTLTVVNGLSQSHTFNSSQSSMKPAPSGAFPTQISTPAKPASPSSRVQPSADSNLDKSLQAHHRCEICSRSFTSLQNLHRHQQYRNTERGFKCTLCCKIFEDRHRLKKHFQDHTYERFHCCGQCGKRFLKVDALSAHKKEKHSLSKASVRGENRLERKLEKTYTCKKCKLSFFWMSDFQTHSVYLCRGKELDVGFTTEIELDSVDADQMEPVNCHFNGATINVKSGNCEMDTESDFRPYRCGLCGDRFEKLTALKEHHITHQTQEEIDKLNQESQRPFRRKIPPKARRRTASNPNGKLHPCKHCHRVFNHSSSLSRHMRYHKGTMHTCVFCGRAFPQRCDLRRHLAMYHKADLDKKPGLKHLLADPQNGSLPEPVISNKHKDIVNDFSDGEQTSSEQSPKEKQSGKTGRVTYKCQECGKKFGLLCVYQRHLRYHKKEPSRCPQCPALFKNSASLEIHLQSHPNIIEPGDGQTSGNVLADEEKSIIDDVEDDVEDDHKHKQTENSPEDLYECTECTQTFSCLDSFLQHQSSHSSENNA